VQGTRQGQCGTENFGRRHQLKPEHKKWVKEPRPETAATKQEGIQLDPRTGVCKVSSRYVQQLVEGSAPSGARNKELDIVAPSEKEKEPTHSVSIR
jgi:hypothetical protein